MISRSRVVLHLGGVLAPGITVDTAGCEQQKRERQARRVSPSGRIAFISARAARPAPMSTPENVSPTSNASPWRL